MGFIEQTHLQGFYLVQSSDGLLPKNHCITTANWEGYTAYWEVQHSHLYLHHLEVCVYDKRKKEEYSLTYQPDQLKKCFNLITKRENLCPLV